MTVDQSWPLLRLVRWLRWRLCHHEWHTVRFQHVREGYWAVIRCRKCGRHHVYGAWTGR